MFGLLAVALGAAGAHKFAGMMTPAEYERFWKTAALYHATHSVVLLALSARPRVHAGAFWSIAAGIVCFSGGLYTFCFWKIPWLMFPITPLGGVLLMVGWAWLIFAREGERRDVTNV